MSNKKFGQCPLRDIEYKSITTTTQNNEQVEKIRNFFSEYLKFYNETKIKECINAYYNMDSDVIEK